MVHYTDSEFKETELVLTGKKEMSPQLKELSKWIASEFKIEVINLIVDYLKHLGKERLQIITRTSQDACKFNESEQWSGNFDSDKQEKIAQKYLEIVKRKPIVKTVLSRLIKKYKYPASKELFVCSSAFNPIARKLTITKLSGEKLMKFEKDLPELWKIQTGFGVADFFLFEDEQVEKLNNSEALEKIKRKFFALIKEHDIYNLFELEHFHIHLDSKENFDKNYESNWYYYYK
ncbi:hypothetical protein [Flammeovirga sp. SJP92]|uniref:hypothetical protein n=1 Tax=Flammeovirga sp. SJP92 TaxID=1775430 RepID=UPI0007883E67|nr:hypothetical protein [Flammeovirga sp. SJP92]KXX66885.1 hypothetical protein AVL50_30615 [Flammeovirga sp. SJP92]